MTRELQPELLDILPADDTDAARSRQDLRRINWWMSHHQLIARTLATLAPGNVHRIVDLGCGDGLLTLMLAQRFAARWPQTDVLLVDRQRIVAPETLEHFRQVGWRPQVIEADVLKWLEGDLLAVDLVIANLFLHHFTEESLRRLLQGIAVRARCFVALEPRRGPVGLACCKLLWLIGCNHVTRHDAQVSVRAGFSGQELSGLWPDARSWSLQEGRAGLFSHLFTATRASL